ncbi:hypothetical protein FZEAL_2070 [Fusarium zealandicum]|uniref:Glutathione S-transferase UstS-like C-terminal domain-containing protein n=1 Tax=Fusarium zealandicum TaxID=1053134 RepID=A0A8H4US95_9HYPO|nr:hypothetical protein FZEAL_2070 [Fusarium zealandicum]
MTDVKSHTAPATWYTVVRPSNFVDRLFYVQHKVGAQANVLVSAHYAPRASAGDNRLSKDAVYSAARAVLEKYPELSLIAIPQLSANGKSHTLQLAALHEIDLDTCVQFLDDEEPAAKPQVIEKLHNEWLWSDDEVNYREPWWKIVVLGGQEVIFVFHHTICDGRFGYFFHREFLAAVNSFNEKHTLSSKIIKIDPERVRLSKEVEQFWTSRTSALRVFPFYIILLLFRLLLGSKLPFTNLPKPRPYSDSFLAKAGPENRTKTRIATLRISAARMRRIIAACRENKATFTPLFAIMMQATLACDVYPEAKVAILNCVFDLRRLYPQEEDPLSSGRLLQCGGSSRKFTWLEGYRRIFPPGSTDKIGNKAEAKKPQVDVEGAWRLVRGYRASIAKSFEGKEPPPIAEFRAANGTSDDLEGIAKSTFPALGTYLNNCIQVSNIGVFATSDPEGPWRIDDIGFSAATVNGNISCSISFNVAGVEGGDTVINATYEDGILSEEMVSVPLIKQLHQHLKGSQHHVLQYLYSIRHPHQDTRRVLVDEHLEEALTTRLNGLNILTSRRDLISSSVPPNESEPQFTLPTVQMPDGSYVMDSYKIADILEEKYPEPSVFLNTPVQLRFRALMIKFMGELMPIYVPGIAQNVLGDESLDFFLASRKEDIGMSLDEYRKQHGPGAFGRAEPFAREITALLNETSSGPYFLGDVVSYADFMWAAILLFFKCLGDEEYEEVLKRSGDAEAHVKFLDALGSWTERND